jgi:hypothetical protein
MPCRRNIILLLARLADRRFTRIDRHLADVQENICIYLENIMAILDSIKAEVARNEDLDQKIIAKLNELGTNTVDPVEVARIAAQLKASNDAKEAVLNPPAVTTDPAPANG